MNIAAGLVVMQRNAEYRPAWVNSSPLLKDPAAGSPPDHTNMAASSMCGPGRWDKLPIFRVQVAKNSLSGLYIRMWLYKTPVATPVDVPCEAFVLGHTYDMYVSKYTIVNGSGVEQTSQDANFILIGHYCDTMPIDL